jgi:hypothetical protein
MLIFEGGSDKKDAKSYMMMVVSSRIPASRTERVDLAVKELV